MRNIFLDDEAIDDEGINEPLDDEDSKHYDSSVRRRPISTSYGHILLRRWSQRAREAKKDQKNASTAEENWALERELNLIGNDRSDGDEDDDADEVDSELADFIVPDDVIESALSENSGLDESGPGLKTERYGGKRQQFQPQKRYKKRNPETKRPPHPRFAFGQMDLEASNAKSMDSTLIPGTRCLSCTRIIPPKAQLKATLAVCVQLEGKLNGKLMDPDVTSSDSHAVRDEIENGKTSAKLKKEKNAILDFEELLNLASQQNLVVTVSDGFGGDFEIIPGEQWSQLENQGDTEVSDIYYCKGSTRSKGLEDYLVMSSSTATLKPRKMKVGSMITDIKTREVLNKILIIPIREVERRFTAAEKGSEKAIVQPSRFITSKLSPTAIREPITKVKRSRTKKEDITVNPRKVILSATKKLRRERRWPLRSIRKLDLFRIITQHRSQPLMEAAREAGYNYLHGPKLILPTLSPPLPNPIFPDRKTLKELLKSSCNFDACLSLPAG